MLTRRAVMAAFACIPVLAACSRFSGPAAPELTLDKVWTRAIDYDPGSGIDHLINRLRILGDTIIVVEGTGTKDGRLLALEAMSGKTSWTITGETPIDAPTVGRVTICVCGPGRFSSPDVIQDPILRSAHDILPVSYVRDEGSRSASGVIGVSLRTGEPVWGFEAMPEPSPHRRLVTAVSDAVVIMTITPDYGPKWPGVDSRCLHQRHGPLAGGPHHGRVPDLPRRRALIRRHHRHAIMPVTLAGNSRQK